MSRTPKRIGGRYFRTTVADRLDPKVGVRAGFECPEEPVHPGEVRSTTPLGCRPRLVSGIVRSATVTARLTGAVGGLSRNKSPVRVEIR